MPIYNFICLTCGQEIEDFVSRIPKNAEEETEMCLGFICCETPMKRVPSLSNFNLKGDCWAKDGYTKRGK